MAEHLRRHGVQPTCSEIMDRRLRDTPAGSQPVTRARDGVQPGGGVAVPTRALIEQESDVIRAAQAPHHPDLPWDRLRRLILDQAPIGVPPATPCLFLDEVHPRGGSMILPQENPPPTAEGKGGLARAPAGHLRKFFYTS